ncbi:hypothetical protein BOW53_00920 [Solemya pervernicosa gill symbiont]|uniref:Formyl transferase N-terminal domain-containing protein n=2 Tax=Solemya pervernicosa gill symbiont TaxID=642797 RepID=A0A1T2LAP6_9GAMM|nr:hypothetical protein BOW53_00920 [Solemya pervernicosa gill symbiont]
MHSKIDQHSRNILFFGDPQLGSHRGWQRFLTYFPNAEHLIWNKGTPKAPLHQALRQKHWDITISFYNDFIFEHDDFPFLGLPLNLHPALPTIRGVGHDHIPLIEGHPEHGGTLHYLQQPPRLWQNAADVIDNGRVIRTRKRELSPLTNYAEIRSANQEIMLEMLSELCEQLLSWGSVESVQQALDVEATENGHSWGKRYIGHSERDIILNTLRLSDPNHRALAIGNQTELPLLSNA